MKFGASSGNDGLKPSKRASAEDNLDSELSDFWEVPATFISDKNIREMYDVIRKQLLQENPEHNLAEALMIDRAAALYCYMRSLEADTGYRNSMDYRQMMKLWIDITQDLRKESVVNVDEAKIRQEVIQDIATSINDAIRGFQPEIQSAMRQAIALALR